jgi:hypothetical protein
VAPRADDRGALERRLQELRDVRAQLDQTIAAMATELESSETDQAGTRRTEGLTVRVRSRLKRRDLDITGFRRSQLPYLVAGEQIIVSLFGLRAKDGGLAELDVVEELLPAVTPTRVCELVGVRSASSFYAQWPNNLGGRDAFVMDLLKFIFGRADTFLPARLDEPKVVAVIQEGIETHSAAEAIHEFAANHIGRQLLQDRLWHFQLYLSSQVNRPDKADHVIRASLERLYRIVDEHYNSQYADVLKNYGVKLREGVSIEDVSWILTALAEGLALRYQAEGTIPDPKSNVFGKAVLALMIALLVREDETSPKSLGEIIDELLSD